MSKCVNCQFDLELQEDHDEDDFCTVKCDFCQCVFNRFIFCRTCYFKPYPLRACSECMEHHPWAIEHIASIEEA